MPLMPGFADLAKSVNQGVLAVGLGRNAEVDGGARGRGAKAFPVSWNGTPSMRRMHIFSMRCEGVREAVEDPSGENAEHRD